MAYAAVVSILLTVEQIIAHPDKRKIFDKKHRIISLYRKAHLLRSYLEDISLESSTDTAKRLERRIRDAVHQAEDIVESHLSNRILFRSSIHGWISALSNRVSRDLQKVLKEIDSCMEELIKARCGLKALLPKNYMSAGRSSRLGADRGKNTMVGFDDELIIIKERLTGQQSKLRVVPIIGMGGIGKTTLARNVYEDSLVMYHFDRRAWVTVSQDYSVKDILLSLLNDILVLSDEKQHETVEELKEHLYRSLKGRRYLIVLDDVWCTKAWDEVKFLFPDDNNGSRVLLTSRMSNVAVYADSSTPIYQMRCMNEHKSWILLCQKVFGRETCPPELETIGRTIAKKCRGLPLAISVIGGILSKASRTQEYWEYVAQDIKTVVNMNDKCFEVFSLSYYTLPHHLKSCLLYMGVFPTDYEIPVSKLTKLWDAEGLLKYVGGQSAEEVAEEYLEDLIDRNLVSVCQRGPDGKMKTCIIHDLLRDLCVRNAQEHMFLYVINRYIHGIRQATDGHRRLSIHSNDLDNANALDNLITDLYNSAEPTSPFRSFLCSGLLPKLTPVYFLFRLLRVLDVVEPKFDRFPAAILGLVNLRYLAFTCSTSIPSSICILWNLHTLINHYKRLPSDMPPISYLPVEILEMRKLRHLQFDKNSFPDPNNGNYTCVLENLETLSIVSNFKCTEEVLKALPNVKKLGIFYQNPSRILDWSEYCLNNLVRLSKLEKLKLLLYSRPNLSFPQNLTFPPTLRKLTLSGCRIPWENMTTVGSLPKLEVLKLRVNAFQGQEWEPTEGEFSRLKFLQIEWMDLVHWRASRVHFPRLESLIIKNCFVLVEIPSGIGDISTLQLIRVDDSSTGAANSAKKIEEEQQYLGNDYLQVHVDPSSYWVNMNFRRSSKINLEQP